MFSGNHSAATRTLGSQWRRRDGDFGGGTRMRYAADEGRSEGSRPHLAAARVPVVSRRQRGSMLLQLRGPSRQTALPDPRERGEPASSHQQHENHHPRLRSVPHPRAVLLRVATQSAQMNSHPKSLKRGVTWSTDLAATVASTAPYSILQQTCQRTSREVCTWGSVIAIWSICDIHTSHEVLTCSSLRHVASPQICSEKLRQRLSAR